MKCRFVLAALAAFVWPSAARSLKGAQAVPTTLEAENDALKKRNKQLEAMMQVAKTEVHRMDVALKHQHIDAGAANVEVRAQEVLNQENVDLKQKLASVQADKKSLVQTLRQMLKRNSTQIFQAQADKAVKLRQAVEMKCAQKQQSCDAQVKEANAKHEEAKDMIQTLQEQNMDLQKVVHEMKDQMAKAEQNGKELGADKANLVTTMHGLMRENSAVKKELQAEKETEKRDLQEIARDEAKIDKLAKLKKVPKEKEARKAPPKVSKNGPLHLNHEESVAFKNAKMDHINDYIDRQYVRDDGNSDVFELSTRPLGTMAFGAEADAYATATPAPDSWKSMSQQVDAMAKEEEAASRKRLQTKHVNGAAAASSQGYGDWMGDLKLVKAKPAAVAIPKDANGLSPIDAIDPDATKQEKIAAAIKAKADDDDGGDGIQELLSQAKDQLSAMDKAEAQ